MKNWYYITASNEQDEHFGYHCKRLTIDELQAYVDQQLIKQATANFVRAYLIPEHRLKPDFFRVAAVAKLPYD